MSEFAFRNNPRLKQVGTKIEWTPETLAEYKKCANDPIYFIENYFMIQHIDKGLVPFKMWDFQREFVKIVHENRFISSRQARQMGKSTVIAAYICWYIIFNEEKPVGIVANKSKAAKNVLKRIKKGYQYIPKWLQQGIVEWNKESIELENGSTIQAAATSSDSIRGESLAFLYVDEVAFVDPKNWDEFWKSTYPVISSGQESKAVLTSTPDGMNHFYYIHTKAQRPVEEGGSEFVAFDAPWHLRPDRNEEWKRVTIANSSEEDFRQEFEIEFIGSSKTLIKPLALADLRSREPVFQTPSINIYQSPQKGQSYLISVDVSRGLKKDYSVFTIIDITNPNKHIEAGNYRNNEVSHMAMPDVIVEYAKMYNNAEVLVELNDLGESVAELIFNHHDYENIVVTQASANRPRLGLVVTKSTKSKGCQSLKQMVESKCLEINNADTISELNTFVEKGITFMAEEGFHDDLVMSLVNYCWYIDSPFFQPDYDYVMSDELKDHNASVINEDMDTPVVVYDSGVESDDDPGRLTKSEMYGFRF